MVERFFDLLLESYTIDELMINKQTLIDPGSGELIQIADILKTGVSADLTEYKSRMGHCAGRLDEYVGKFMGDEPRITASGLSGEYEYEACLYGFLMGFKAAMQLMNGKYPGACV